jgi:hypothetical protein
MVRVVGTRSDVYFSYSYSDKINEIFSLISLLVINSENVLTFSSTKSLSIASKFCSFLSINYEKN